MLESFFSRNKVAIIITLKLIHFGAIIGLGSNLMHDFTSPAKRHNSYSKVYGSCIVCSEDSYGF